MVCTESFATSDDQGRDVIVGQGLQYPSDHPAVKLCPERFAEVAPEP
jgi:hypothetical protein